MLQLRWTKIIKDIHNTTTSSKRSIRQFTSLPLSSIAFNQGNWTQKIGNGPYKKVLMQNNNIRNKVRCLYIIISFDLIGMNPLLGQFRSSFF